MRRSVYVWTGAARMQGRRKQTHFGLAIISSELTVGRLGILRTQEDLRSHSRWTANPHAQSSYRPAPGLPSESCDSDHGNMNQKAEGRWPIGALGAPVLMVEVTRGAANDLNRDLLQPPFAVQNRRLCVALCPPRCVSRIDRWPRLATSGGCGSCEDYGGGPFSSRSCAPAGKSMHRPVRRPSQPGQDPRSAPPAPWDRDPRRYSRGVRFSGA